MRPEAKEVLQRVFDNGVRGILAQGKPSGMGGGCQYEMGDGAKCGIGHSIDTSMNRNGELEGLAAFECEVVEAIASGLKVDFGLVDECRRELEQFQTLHDESAYVYEREDEDEVQGSIDFIAKFRDAAAAFGAIYKLDMGCLANR